MATCFLGRQTPEGLHATAYRRIVRVPLVRIEPNFKFSWALPYMGVFYQTQLRWVRLPKGLRPDFPPDTYPPEANDFRIEFGDLMAYIAENHPRGGSAIRQKIFDDATAAAAMYEALPLRLPPAPIASNDHGLPASTSTSKVSNGDQGGEGNDDAPSSPRASTTPVPAEPSTPTAQVIPPPAATRTSSRIRSAPRRYAKDYVPIPLAPGKSTKKGMDPIDESDVSNDQDETYSTESVDDEDSAADERPAPRGRGAVKRDAKKGVVSKSKNSGGAAKKGASKTAASKATSMGEGVGDAASKRPRVASPPLNGSASRQEPPAKRVRASARTNDDDMEVTAGRGVSANDDDMEVDFYQGIGPITDAEDEEEEGFLPVPSVDKGKGRALRSPSPARDLSPLPNVLAMRSLSPHRGRSPRRNPLPPLSPSRSPSRGRTRSHRRGRRSSSIPSLRSIVSSDNGRSRSRSSPPSPRNSPPPPALSKPRRKMSKQERLRVTELMETITALAEELSISPAQLLKEGGFGISLAQTKENAWNVFQRWLARQSDTPKRKLYSDL